MQKAIKIIRVYALTMLVFTLGATMQSYLDILQVALIELLVFIWVWCVGEVIALLLPYLKHKENPNAVLVPSEFAEGVVKHYKRHIDVRVNPTKVNKLKIKKFYANKKS